MRFQMSISHEMGKCLKEESRCRKLDSIQETIRSILSEYFMMKENEKPAKRIVRLEERNPLAH